MLVLAISVSAYAGEMPCDKTGDIGAGGRAVVTDPVKDIALHLLQSVLPLF